MEVEDAVEDAAPISLSYCRSSDISAARSRAVGSAILKTTSAFVRYKICYLLYHGQEFNMGAVVAGGITNDCSSSAPEPHLHRAM